jgi:hypothetical protein
MKTLKELLEEYKEINEKNGENKFYLMELCPPVLKQKTKAEIEQNNQKLKELEEEILLRYGE